MLFGSTSEKNDGQGEGVGVVPSGYGILVNYGKRGYEKRGDRSGVFHFEGEMLGPLHNVGTFVSAYHLVYGAPLRLDVQQHSPVDFDFHLSW